MSNMEIFEKYESEVRGYCRGFPPVFDKAKNATLWNTEGDEYVDFFGGAGALNYGHNNDHLKKALLQYIEDDRITHGLDMSTKAKEEFLIAFHDIILKPRGLDYKIQFPGPTGTNTVEAALKLVRKVKEQELVISFTNGFHGMTLGALAVTANGFKRGGAGLP
ncbi:MAG: aminotransferase class III-fold pyridoxal phosphate-dependent enzyme, partial [Alphaproteobacteria bacterium]|nr:aminotransferase class III-fold pyridoxal phosphate-dependent enzyme [Alphaproteobacteria bacterium]